LGFLIHLFPLIFSFRRHQQLFSFTFQPLSFLPMAYSQVLIMQLLELLLQLDYFHLNLP